VCLDEVEEWRWWDICLIGWGVGDVYDIGVCEDEDEDTWMPWCFEKLVWEKTVVYSIAWVIGNERNVYQNIYDTAIDEFFLFS
jgi:hypothetical protein